jgi:hypothetical protein
MYEQFHYDIGNLVQLAWRRPYYQVTWRGWVFEPNGRGNGVRRLSVYRLDNGHWDCYHEDELHDTFWTWEEWKK